MFTSDNPTGQFNRVECDLSDVLGTPGLGGADDVAGRVGRTLRLNFEALPARPGLYLRSTGGFGAFAAPATALTATSDAVDHYLAATAMRGRARPRAGRPASQKVLSKVASPSAVHQQYVQTVSGRRVIGGAYRVHAGRTGELRVTGNPIGDLADRDPGPPPRLRRRAAVLEAIRGHLRLRAPVKLRIETVLFPLDGGAVWAFLGRGSYRDDDVIADLRVIVRADDLSLLVSRDAAASAVFGEADVFSANPGRDPNTSAVRLPELAGAELTSSMFDVSPARGARPTRPLRDWRTAIADAEFDDVSAYYHLSRAANWFAPLVGADLFKKAPFNPLKVITRDRATRGQVGRFLPSDGEITFDDDVRPGARSADICIHEFTHAVVWAAHRIDDVDTLEARGLNEGYADYAQASLLDNPLFGDWVKPDQARDCASPSVRFPADMANALSEYDIGAAWAAVLWEIRQEIGAPIADALAFDTIFYLDETSPVDSARTALLDSDARLFPSDDGNGRHAGVIEEAFDRRLP